MEISIDDEPDWRTILPFSALRREGVLEEPVRRCCRRDVAELSMIMSSGDRYTGDPSLISTESTAAATTPSTNITDVTMRDLAAVVHRAAS
jgi:hypothetical protein